MSWSLRTTARRSLAILLLGLACGGVTDPEPGTGQAGNGEWIAIQGRDSGNRLQIFLIRPDGTGRRQLTFEGENGTPSWSPDGERIAFSSTRRGNHGVFTMRSDGSDQRLLVDHAQFPDWSARDEIAYISMDNSDGAGRMMIWVVNADGTGKRQLTFKAGATLATVHPSWSPDGGQLTFALITPDPTSPAGFNPEIWVIGRDGSNLRLVTSTDPNNTRPDGGFLNTAHDANAPDFGPEGWIAFWSGEENSFGQVWKAKTDGSERTQLTKTPVLTRNDDPAWSPDGTKILFATDRRGSNELWTMNADGSDPHFLSPNAAVPYPGDPAWQPRQRR